MRRLHRENAGAPGRGCLARGKARIKKSSPVTTSGKKTGFKLGPAWFSRKKPRKEKKLRGGTGQKKEKGAAGAKRMIRGGQDSKIGQIKPKKECAGKIRYKNRNLTKSSRNYSKKDTPSSGPSTTPERPANIQAPENADRESIQVSQRDCVTTKETRGTGLGKGLGGKTRLERGGKPCCARN